jgi:hypothetical protein
MLKKVAIVGAAGLLTAAVLTQTHVGSYLSHQFNKADKYLESKSESMPERGDFRLHQSDTNRPLAQNLTRSALAASLKLGLLAGVLQLYSAQD